MKKCYIYTRVSTAVQVDGYSLDAQKTALYRYAACHDMEIVEEYCDAGISGGSIRGRRDFQRMLDDVMDEKDSVDFVVVFKLSRFGRNVADVLRSIQYLRDYDVDLVSIDEGIDSSTSSGRLMISILSAVAEMEKENIRCQFNAGKMQKFKNGGWTGGGVPYGYRSDGGRLLIVKEEAEVVRLIFNSYLEGDNGISTVVNILNAKGLRPKKRETYNRSSVISILKNPLYCGDMYYNRRTNIKGAKPKEVIYSKGIHEPIISEEVFYNAQDKLTERSKKTPEVKEPERISLLSGLVKCPLCGVGMVAVHNRTKSKRVDGGVSAYHGYMCNNHRKLNGRTCSYDRQLNQHVIDDAVTEYVGKIGNLTSFNDYMSNLLAREEDYEEIETRLRQLRKSYYHTEHNKDRVNANIDGLDVLSDSYADDLDRLMNEADSLYDEMGRIEDEITKLEKYRDSIQEGRITLEKINAYLDSFPELIQKMDCHEKRKMFRFLIERIDVFPERRDDGKIIKSITFKFPVYKLDKHGNPIRELDNTVGYKMRCDNIGRTAAESKATYAQIKRYVWENHQVKIHSLYIAQIKRKCGIVERMNYNKSKKENPRTVVCPPDKEEYILEAFKHFKMITGNEVKALNG